MFGMKPSADRNVSKFFLLDPLAVVGSTGWEYVDCSFYYNTVSLMSVLLLELTVSLVSRELPGLMSILVLVRTDSLWDVSANGQF